MHGIFLHILYILLAVFILYSPKAIYSHNQLSAPQDIHIVKSNRIKAHAVICVVQLDK